MNEPVLNLEQQAVKDAREGVIVVIAGPGAGKTTVLLERHVGMLMSGIQQRDILNLTFTSAAASEMVRRIGILNADKVFRTFHSYALELLKKERAAIPFQMTDTIIPVSGEEYELLFDLVKAYPAISSFRTLQGRISEWKRMSIEPEEAIRDAIGKEYYYANAYADYETRCRYQGWLDFDSMMHESVKMLGEKEDVRNRNKKRYISVDECQDTDITQFKLLQHLFGGNILVVGDENQCQPPGTLVDVLVSPAHGVTKAHVESVPIEKLSDKDRLVSWDSHSKRIRLGIGRCFRRAIRGYNGTLLHLKAGNRQTRVTPNHLIWTKFNRVALKKKTHFVYLMWRKDLGFRIGTSSLRTASGANQISHRGYQERADKMWILEITESDKEARTREEIYSLQYQIPERIFQDRDAGRIFKSISWAGGFRLLVEKGLLFEQPLVSWGGKKHLTKFHGYFKTAAANLLEGLMDLPTEQPYRSARIDQIQKQEYHGPVYSLKVAKDHTYIADGIPIGNCIYEWRSAQPGSLTNFAKTFPGARTLYLGQNYRSTERLVRFFKAIIPVDNGLASHMKTEREAGVDPVFMKYPDGDTEARRVLDAASKDPENSVIIARTNRQLFGIQRIATAKEIKYKNLGKRDFWEQNEVKALLNLAKGGSQSEDASKSLLSVIHGNNLFNRYRNTGDPMNSDPIENLNNVVKIAANKKMSLGEFLGYINKLTHARKSRKEKDLMLATVHQAKGREWKNVFVIGADQGMMPHKDGELSEEKRIFFVACTRASDNLQISWSQSRSMFLDQYADQVREYRKELDGPSASIERYAT